MIFFHLSTAWFIVIAKYDFRKSADQFSAEIDQLFFGNLILQSLNHVDVNLKSWFIIKSRYYIVPSPSTALTTMLLGLLNRIVSTYVSLSND